VVERFLARELGPEGRLQSAAENARAIGRILTGLPDVLSTLERAARLYEERGAQDETEARADKRWRALTLAVALAALAIAVVAAL
jgi:ubiquinone biosynthesis protein